MIKKTFGFIVLFTLSLATLPLVSLAATYTPGSVVFDQNGNRMTASINLHGNPNAGTNDIVWTAQVNAMVIFAGQGGSRFWMCVIDESAGSLYDVAVQARTGFSNGGQLRITKNSAGECTSIVAANSSEFFE